VPFPRVYFDHNASTPVSPEVLEVYVAALRDVAANPSSVHQDGQLARRRLDEARAQVGRLLGCGPKDIVFTSGGTESDNLAILGAVRASGRASRHVVTTAIEHPAVLNACRQLEQEGVRVTYVRPERDGWVNPEAIRAAVEPDTVLVSVMHANNETGVVQPIGEIGRVTRELGILFHSDGVQAAGKILVSAPKLGVDLYSISGHKINAPKGVGALYVRKGVTLQPLQFGGRHESGRRAGTENVPGAIALGAAAERARIHMDEQVQVWSRVRYRIERRVAGEIPQVMVNGWTAPRLPNTVNVMFDGIEGEALVIALDLRGFAVSSGSACSSGAVEPSHVLTAMGLAPEQAKASLRFSVGLGNTVEEADALVDAIAASCAHLRRLSPVYVEATA
jgi:cysteine desulfurase